MANKHSAETLLALLRQHWPEAVTPTTELMVRVYRLNDLVRHNAQQQAGEHGLSFIELEVLLALRSVGPPWELTPTDLYQAALISSGGLTKVLGHLRQRGLISRHSASKDKRSKLARLTPAGRTRVEQAMGAVLAADRELLASGLDAPEVQRLTHLVAKLLAALETTTAAKGTASAPS